MWLDAEAPFKGRTTVYTQRRHERSVRNPVRKIREYNQRSAKTRNHSSRSPVIMSSCHISAFCTITTHRQMVLHRPIPSAAAPAFDPSTAFPLRVYAHYQCALNGASGIITTADIRAPAPYDNDILPVGSVIYVAGTIIIRTDGERSLIDANHIDVLPLREPLSTHPDLASRFPAPLVHGMGAIVGKHSTTSSDAWLFPLTISQFMRNDINTFQIALRPPPPSRFHVTHMLPRCLINPHHFHWQNAQFPRLGSFVFFNGIIVRVQQSGTVVVEVDAFYHKFSFGHLSTIERCPNIFEGSILRLRPTRPNPDEADSETETE